MNKDKKPYRLQDFTSLTDAMLNSVSPKIEVQVAGSRITTAKTQEDKKACKLQDFTSQTEAMLNTCRLPRLRFN